MHQTLQVDTTAVAEAANRITESVERVISGKRGQIHLALTVILAGGHLLIEDVPGVGKTALAGALAKSIEARVARIQFTPDLLPGDVTGTSIFNQATREFEFQPGPVFANIVIADEINRASPKTQSALLESMGEQQVTTDGVTRRLARPFFVVATQNPSDMEGTYALPEAQRDRFMARMAMGYPAVEAEIAMIGDRQGRSPIDEVRPVVDTAGFARLIDIVEQVHVADPVKQYIVALIGATRSHADVLLGASPRATLQLVRASKARAAIAGRGYVTPQDVGALAISVLAHRLSANRGSDSYADRARIIREIVQQLPVERAVTD